MPEFNFQGALSFFLVYTALCCVVPMAALAAGVWIAFQRGQSFFTEVITPDVDKMHSAYTQLRERNPNASADALVRQIIQRQSLRCGLVGALTGLAGLVTLPIALPVDIVMSYRIQGAMVTFIARAYGKDPAVLGSADAVPSLVMFGTSRLTQSATKALNSVALGALGKALAKIVPFLGAGIGFAVNYFTTQATGHLAAQVYSGNLQTVGQSSWRTLRQGVRLPKRAPKSNPKADPPEN